MNLNIWIRGFVTALIIAIIHNENFISCYLAYQRPNCETSIFSVVQNMVINEVFGFLNPRYRSVASNYVKYDLYTPRNRYEAQSLQTDDIDMLNSSNFNPKWQTRFLIHGWAGKSTSCSNAAIKDAYLTRGEFNVIIVDWSVLAHHVNYSRIYLQFPEIAAHIVKFINFLQQYTSMTLDKVYLVGHSAGCHISSLVGKLLKPQLLGAIVALDPAGLNHLELSEDYRLTPTDAKYVESIHTDVLHLGNPSFNLSHATFFPNWGLGQPNCPNDTATEFDFACDHFSALYYFAQSIQNPKLFGALKLSNPNCLRQYNCSCPNGASLCTPLAYMGGEPLVPKRGVYYLSTKSTVPFGYGDKVRIGGVKTPSFREINPKSYYMFNTRSNFLL